MLLSSLRPRKPDIGGLGGKCWEEIEYRGKRPLSWPDVMPHVLRT